MDSDSHLLSTKEIIFSTFYVKHSLKQFFCLFVFKVGVDLCHFNQNQNFRVFKCPLSFIYILVNHIRINSFNRHQTSNPNIKHAVIN